jgi:hypothetical protein
MSRIHAVGLSLVALTILAAPTVGDIGGCGQRVEQLDPAKFFAQKQIIDCTKCTACGFATASCERSCTERIDDPAFPEDCFPLAHDGEVCLNALEAASCDAYAAFVDDVAPTIPTECNFCPLDRKPEAQP